MGSNEMRSLLEVLMMRRLKGDTFGGRPLLTLPSPRAERDEFGLQDALAPPSLLHLLVQGVTRHGRRRQIPAFPVGAPRLGRSHAASRLQGDGRGAASHSSGVGADLRLRRWDGTAVVRPHASTGAGAVPNGACGADRMGRCVGRAPSARWDPRLRRPYGRI